MIEDPIQNFDFVSMSDYISDTKELVGQATSNIEFWRKKAERAERLAMEAIIASGGSVEIAAVNLQDPSAVYELKTWVNDRDNTYAFNVKRR